MQTLKLLALDKLTEHPQNPRRTFRAVKELAANLEKHGLIHPITAAPAGSKYVILSGHRRYRAAQLADLGTVPVTILEGLTDDEALDILFAANLQTEAPDPFEEAEAFRARADVQKWTPEQIAERHNVTPGYVARRLKLLDLIPELREAFANDRIGLAQAEALALGGAEFQQKYVPNLQNDWRGLPGNLPSGRAIRQAYASTQTIPLSAATFKTSEPFPQLDRPPCAQCAYNTGCAPNLFDAADFEKPKAAAASCTNAECFQARQKAAAERYVAAGRQAISLHYADHGHYNDWDLKGRRKDAGPDALAVVVTRSTDPRDIGRIGFVAPRGSSGTAAAAKRDPRIRLWAKRAKEMTKARRALLGELGERFGLSTNLEAQRLIARLLFEHATHEGQEAVCKLYDVKKYSHRADDERPAFADWIQTAQASDCDTVLGVLALGHLTSCRPPYEGAGGRETWLGDDFDKACKLVGIKPPTPETSLELEPKRSAKKAAKKAAKPKRSAKKAAKKAAKPKR